MRNLLDQTFLEEVTAAISPAIRWWLNEIVALIPARVRQALHRPNEKLVVEVIDDDVILLREAGHDRSEIARLGWKAWTSGMLPEDAAAELRALPSDSKTVSVRLMNGHVLNRQIELPHTTKQHLRQALAFELERRTPFAVEQVYFDFRIVSRDRDAKRSKLDVVIAKRATVDLVLATLNKWGVEPRFVGAAPAHGAPACNLLPKKGGFALQSWRPRLTTILAGTAATLSIGTVAVLWRHEAQVSNLLSAQLAAASSGAEAMDRLRKEYEDLIQRQDFLVREKQNTPIVAVVRDVTHLLPDGTWLFGLEISGREVRIRGFSDAAPSLLGIFDGSAIFTNARFRAPVTQGPRADLERFELSFEIREGAP